jgi:hypothetical protein
MESDNALTLSGWDLPDFFMCPSQIENILTANLPSHRPWDADEMEDEQELRLSLPDSDSEDLSSGDRECFLSPSAWTSYNGHSSGHDEADNADRQKDEVDSACPTPEFTPSHATTTTSSSSSSRFPALDVRPTPSFTPSCSSRSPALNERTASSPPARASSSRTKSKCSIAARQRQQAEALKDWVETENGGRPFATAEDKELLAARLAMSVSQVKATPPCFGFKQPAVVDPDTCPISASAMFRTAKQGRWTPLRKTQWLTSSSFSQVTNFFNNARKRYGKDKGGYKSWKACGKPGRVRC